MPLGTQSGEGSAVPSVEAVQEDRENTDGNAAKTVARASAKDPPEGSISSAGDQTKELALPLVGRSEHPPDTEAERRSEEGCGDRSPAESGTRATYERESEAAARFARLPETPPPDSQAKPQRRSAFTIARTQSASREPF
jgi:hypothetical protein